ncbi:penicillin-binding protein 2 [Nocardioides sp. YIM 123512]|uniref:Penicillin-binding protein 2 n=2 Tax=Nocardioides flavescens TaxID=2691959 RepID=A0A6L7EU12_9ACTN|nr:penicillin-binding protein 2 [Nocardioides flavescens]MXG90833.1 penicillin-binding protein 2 [Nocardioides flavescens]
MVFSLFAARLVQLQGVDPGQYAAMAAAAGTRTLTLPAQRGEIFDRFGEPLADSVEGRAVIANPAETTDDAPAVAAFLARELGVDYTTTLRKLRVKGSQFQYIARHVPATKADDVLAAAKAQSDDVDGFKGLFTQRDPIRIYPAHDVAANVLGFVGEPSKKADVEAGRTYQAYGGLEEAFNKALSGKDGEERYEFGAGDTRLPLGNNTTVAPVDGQDITTTIDRDLQWYAQRTLRQAVIGAKARSGIAIVMDTQTGELLTLADYPTFDAEDPASAHKSDRQARSLNLAYEPGSVEKVLTMAALLDEGKVTPRTKLLVPGQLDRQDRPIKDHWEHGLIKLTLAGVLAKSSNIGTVLAADRFGSGELRSYLEKFGLGAVSGVGLGGETRGSIPEGPAWTSQVGDRIAFGQSLSVNAVQMAAAVNTIANGGVRVDPTLIRGEATRDDGTRVGTDVSTTRRVVSEEAARQTTKMMQLVVDPEDGVAPAAQVPGYSVAGKTGTAQRVGTCVVDGVKQGCYDGTVTVSFAGFAPAENPRFTVYVALQAPTVAGAGGGATAGPVFSKIMGQALQRYSVPESTAPGKKYPVEW